MGSSILKANNEERNNIMFKLIFGLIWTAISSLVAFMMYANKGGTIEVNGEVVSQAEFNSMLFPKLFIGLFIFIGLFMIFSGLKEIFTNIQTNKLGVETYGIVTDIRPTGSYVNGKPELKAEVLVYIDDYNIETYEEIIGFDRMKYKIGDYVKVKHHNKDINIVEETREDYIPMDIKDLLDNESEGVLNTKTFDSNFSIIGGSKETIIIDGVEYVRK